ncbi:uncharacterized protein [Parasteatoda tepidariorum]|uniref:uncharacterized protein n=1 Tax=Parasteatoda tepidariorum TaxID=114398 RepID=UPI00077FE2A7|nr:uncharacterized protein LOC107453490 [Parasteatoda tepidariorum]
MTTLNQKEVVSKISHEYSTSWSLKNIKSLGSKSIKTDEFSPIPGSTFYFEILYQENSSVEKISYFKMMFVKKAGINIPKSMRMNITVSVNTSYNAILKTYQNFEIRVNEMDVVTISSEIFKYFVYDKAVKGYKATGDPCFGNHSELLIKSNLVFFEILVSPSDYFHDKRLLKNLKEFVNDFDCMYESCLLTDIEFKIGNESFSVHKCILAAHSPVLRRMISSDFSESKTNTISINDSSPEIFKCFLKYLYSGKIEDKTWSVVKELLILADKYDVRSLRTKCGEILASFLSIDNIYEILKIAYEYGDEYLKEEANVFAVKHILEIAPNDEWKELTDSNPVIGYNVMKNFAPKFPSIPQFGGFSIIKCNSE